MSEDPLRDAYKAYLVALDCFRIADGAINQDAGYVASTVFAESTPDELAAAIHSGKAQLDKAAIVLMWSHFERFVIERIQAREAQLSSVHPAGFSRSLAAKFKAEVERWRPGDILDLFKGEVDAGRLGGVKQIKKYRDWIAHRNPKSATPTRTDPKATYKLLASVIQEIRDAHALPA